MQEKNMGHICPIGRSGVKVQYPKEFSSNHPVQYIFYFFLRRRFISTKQIYKKNHTYYTKHTIYKRKEIKAKKRLEILKEGRKRNGGSHMSFKQPRDIIRSSCSAYILFMQSTR